MLSINRELAWMAPIDGFAFRVVKPYRLGTVVGSLPSGCLPIDGARRGGRETTGSSNPSPRDTCGMGHHVARTNIISTFFVIQKCNFECSSFALQQSSIQHKEGKPTVSIGLWRTTSKIHVILTMMAAPPTTNHCTPAQRACIYTIAFAWTVRARERDETKDYQYCRGTEQLPAPK